jgi:uncharacterized protein YecE (DUF72 family)
MLKRATQPSKDRGGGEEVVEAAHYVVGGWASKTPEGFVFAAKVPRVITHDTVLVDCEAEFRQFVATMDILGAKLGPLLLQFGYFNKKAFPGVNDFLTRLRPFLKKLPKDHKFAVEIRNKHWLVPEFVEVLKERGVALALIDQSWMPKPVEWFEKLDPITADFTYIRWLGDRMGIEEQTKKWDKTIVDRREDLSAWVKLCHPFALIAPRSTGQTTFASVEAFFLKGCLTPPLSLIVS